MKLFKRAWMSRNERWALAAVNHESDEATLRQIAQEARLYAVRLKAAEKVDDQELYKLLAQVDPDPYLRVGMALHVDDVEFLEEFIKNPDMKMGLGEIRDYVDSLIQQRRNEANREQFAEIPAMDDVSRLVEIATSNHMLDVYRRRDEGWHVYGASEPKTIEDEMREAAVERLAALGADEALTQIVSSHDAQDSGIAESAVSKIANEHLLYDIAIKSDALVGYDAQGQTTYDALVRVVGRMTDRDLLGRMREMHTDQCLGMKHVEELAEHRLRELRSEDLCCGEHNCECVRFYDEKRNDYRSRNYQFRCRWCGAERNEFGHD